MGTWSRDQACEQIRKTAAAAQVTACVCDPTIPWPTCSSMVGLHSDASLAPLVQQAGSDVSAMRRRLVEQAAAVAADYGTEARAWEDVRRMRRNVQDRRRLLVDPGRGAEDGM